MPQVNGPSVSYLLKELNRVLVKNENDSKRFREQVHSYREAFMKKREVFVKENEAD